ncbi:ABC transporter substrate-binding protein [Fuchsiella alkaliacetigena]|uniref:ABC transporter substrate-binding protein n=1 Tax=Fuchsiella alkaliacetigena TaxID=957042 RepID=UPI00200A3E5C|nr:ABC transporter substrate-binding protein [Fuchsiella alkaliacetigena]MCK8823644.1 ABC transporter substrate-binding protein [Fuchsiella alkaliacetigena]
MFKKASSRLSLLVLICLLIMMTVACGVEEATEESVEEETVDVVRLEGGQDDGYPSPYAHHRRGPGSYKMNLIFDSMLERDEEGWVPWLAEDYEISEDGLEILFTIRDGVKWQDGEEMTAEDVKFSYEYSLEYPMVRTYVQKDDEIEVELKNDNQVLFIAPEPDAVLAHDLGRIPIIPKHIWKDVDDPENYLEEEAVVGTGPYQLDEYNLEHGTYRFEAFEDFWGPNQSVEAIEFIPVSDDIMAFEQGDIDLTRIGTDLLSRFEEQEGFEVVQNPAFWGYRLRFNMEDNPQLEVTELRQAINYALDLEDVVDRDARGAGVAGNAGIVPPDHVMYNPEVKEYDQDLDKAEELLIKLGYENTTEEGVRYNEAGEELSFDLFVRDDDVRLGEIVEEQLSDLGIGVNVISEERQSHDDRLRNYDYQLIIHGGGGWGGDPDYLRERFMSPAADERGDVEQQSLGYDNSELNQLLAEQRYEVDEERREEMIFEVQEILAEDIPQIPLYYPAEYTAYRADSYDDWMHMFDHHALEHPKLSYLERD